MSPHACGAWIEVLSKKIADILACRRPTHVGRGLKFECCITFDAAPSGRPTHVGRGLKSALFEICKSAYQSPHACGAWIEV